MFSCITWPRLFLRLLINKNLFLNVILLPDSFVLCKHNNYKRSNYYCKFSCERIINKEVI